MRTLIILTLLAILVIATTCYESYESMESYEYLKPFINRRSASDFIRASARLQASSRERIREQHKMLNEVRREICEDYPCNLGSPYGYAPAYRQYFGRRRTE